MHTSFTCERKDCTYTQTHATCPTESQLSINTLGYIIRVPHKVGELWLWGVSLLSAVQSRALGPTRCQAEPPCGQTSGSDAIAGGPRGGVRKETTPEDRTKDLDLTASLRQDLRCENTQVPSGEFISHFHNNS